MPRQQGSSLWAPGRAWQAGWGEAAATRPQLPRIIFTLCCQSWEPERAACFMMFTISLSTPDMSSPHQWVSYMQLPRENTHRAHRPEAMESWQLGPSGTGQVRLVGVRLSCRVNQGAPGSWWPKGTSAIMETLEPGLQEVDPSDGSMNIRTSEAQKGESIYSRMNSWLR